MEIRSRSCIKTVPLNMRLIWVSEEFLDLEIRNRSGIKTVPLNRTSFRVRGVLEIRRRSWLEAGSANKKAISDESR